MSQRYCPECEMVLAAGVAKCRFCGSELPSGFWGDRAFVTRARSGDLQSGPSGQSESDEVGFNQVLASASFTPIPPSFPETVESGGGRGSGPIDPSAPGPGSGGGFAPPPNLTQARSRPGQQPAAPGRSVASRALAAELDRVTRTSEPDLAPSAPQRSASSSPSPAPPRSSAQIEAFDSRQLAFVGGLVLALLTAGVLWLLASGPSSSAPGRQCGSECQAAFDLRAKTEPSLNHMEFMSRCVQSCMRPAPEPTAPKK